MVEANSKSPWKHHSWNSGFPFGFRPLFKGELTVSFWGGRKTWVEINIRTLQSSPFGDFGVSGYQPATNPERQSATKIQYIIAANDSTFQDVIFTLFKDK